MLSDVTIISELSHRVVILFLFAVPIALGQQPTASDAQFEAASIRPAHWTIGCYSILPPGGMHYRLTCVSLRELIALAWRLHPDNIQGGDGAALSTYYNLDATTPGDKPWTRDSIPPMLRNLLTERFHVSVSPGTKQMSGLSLVVAQGGFKLKPVEASPETGSISQNFVLPGYVRGRGVNLSNIASLLSAPARETVQDQTGVPGIYNIDLHFAIPDDTDSTLPSFFTAVEEQLGLKLKPGKVTINTLVIERADLSPRPN